MTELKCPFCQQELDTGRYYVRCHNPHCNTTVEMEGTEELWQELITTRKALDLAIGALDNIKKNCMTMIETESVCRYALEQIKDKEE